MSGSPRSDSSAQEESARSHTPVFGVLAIIVILAVGFIAGVVDNAITGHGNMFILNLRDVLLVVASTAPWIVLFSILCFAWCVVANRLFIRWNSTLNKPGDPAYGKGIIYEIVQDNNAAAAIVLIMPTLTIALALVYIAILNKTAG
jgi:hypothetical protein